MKLKSIIVASLAAAFLSSGSAGLAQERAWTELHPATSPPFGYYSGMAYDSARGQVVLFGGIDSSVVSGLPHNVSSETWTWDGSVWTRQSPQHVPPARCAFGMAYDAAREQVVIFGGANPGGFLSDTWVWDGVDWRRRADGPGPRLHLGMTYDEARQEVVLFGGGAGTPTPYGDTWVWDGAAWTQKATAHSPARSNFRMAFDASRGEVVLFGGWNGSTWADDTWTWDGVDWTPRAQSAAAPPARQDASIAYDEGLQQIVLFGGIRPNCTPVDESTWTWDGAKWTQAPLVVSPGGRGGAAAAYDSARGQVVLFGGNDCSHVFAETWVWGDMVSANAGVDQSVEEGSSVTLQGTATGPDGVSYSWLQVAGPAVALSNETTLTPSFVAPWLSGGTTGNQTLTFSLTVSLGGMASTAVVNVLVRNMNHAPVADAGQPQTVNEGSMVTLRGTDSYDPDGDPITCLWTQTAGEPVALQASHSCSASFNAPLIPGHMDPSVTFAFGLAVSDSQLTGQATMTVKVEQVNHPPIALPGPNQTVSELTVATLDGSGSSDQDSDPLIYQWAQTGGPGVTLSNPAGRLPSFTAPEVGPGGANLVFRLIVSDGLLTSPPAATTVTVVDVNDPPSCTLGRANPLLLWPPNHKMVAVGIVGVTDPQDDQVGITVTGITQDEPVNGTGDGDSSPDGSLNGGTALVRSERAGSGNGRVYRIQFTADDGRGGTCAGSVSVGVPHNAKDTPADDGQGYDATRGLR